MVTPQGFNALLKIVEEPPEHVKFIFATTEPEKVIGTIRSRTHHYPFRLVPPAQMLEYIQQICESEKVTAAPGVLSLVVRAGGGSVRDTLSLLDQLIAGSEGPNVDSASNQTGVIVRYERAVALLGYTHGALLDEAIDAIGARDSAAVFAAVDRVIQTGQDPRRFVEDLLERLRDLIIVAATADKASAVLRGMPEDQLAKMSQQATLFGQAELSRAADVVNSALTEMTGATSPRLHLELMVARILVPASDQTDRGALARVERLERRIGVDDGAQPRPVEPMDEKQEVPATTVQSTTAQPATAISIQQVKDAWPEILGIVEKEKRTAWMVVYASRVLDLAGDVLTLSFASENDVASFKQPPAAGDGVSEYLRGAILKVLGLRVKFVARVDVPLSDALEADVSEADAPEPDLPEGEAQTSTGPATTGDAENTGWPVTQIPESAPTKPAQRERAKVGAAAKPAGKQASPADGRYGESVVRELLGASFIEELEIAPTVVPIPKGE
jgi:DNA polymerase III subunit gamma/tau